MKTYQLLQEIKTLDLPTAWIASHVSSGTHALLQTLTIAAGQRPVALRAGQYASQLRHAHVLAVVDFGIDEESGDYYVATEEPSKETLHVWMRDGRPIPLLRRLIIASQLARALSFAHRQGVAHGHLDMSRVHLLTNGNVQLAGFGFGDLDNPKQDLLSFGLLLCRLLAHPKAVTEVTQKNIAKVLERLYALLPSEKAIREEDPSTALVRLLHYCLLGFKSLASATMQPALQCLLDVLRKAVEGQLKLGRAEEEAGSWDELEEQMLLEPALKEIEELEQELSLPASPQPAPAITPPRQQPQIAKKPEPQSAPAQEAAPAPTPPRPAHRQAETPEARPQAPASKLPLLLIGAAGVAVAIGGFLWLGRTPPQPEASPSPTAVSAPPATEPPAPTAAAPTPSAPPPESPTAPLPASPTPTEEPATSTPEPEPSPATAAAPASATTTRTRTPSRTPTPTQPHNPSKTPTQPPPTATAEATQTPTPRPLPPTLTPTREIPPTNTPSLEDIEEKAIRNTLEAFRLASEQLDVDAIQDLWPTLDSQSASALRKLYSTYKSQTMKLTVTRISFDFSENKANVEAEVEVTITPKQGAASTTKKPLRLNLKKTKNGWRIES